MGKSFYQLKQKGLIPLFITGAGVSIIEDVKPEKQIPNIYGIIDLLSQKYKNKPECRRDEIDQLFQTLEKLNNKNKRTGEQLQDY